MKLSQTSRKKLKTNIYRTLSEFPEIRSKYVEKVKHLNNTRKIWDIIGYFGMSDLMCEFYKIDEVNDDHIRTALRIIMKEIFPELNIE